VHGHFWIPIDDEHCWAWSYDFHPTRGITNAERDAMKRGKGIHVLNMPGTFRPVANRDNDYLINREAQRRGETYSGVEGIAMQDASLQESMGPIVDRTKETWSRPTTGSSWRVIGCCAPRSCWPKRTPRRRASSLHTSGCVPPR